MKKGVIALVILGIVGVIGWQQWRSHKPAVNLKGTVGGEKVALMEDAKITDILKSRYSLQLGVTKAGEHTHDGDKNQGDGR